MTTPTGSRRDRTTLFRNQLGMAFFVHFLAESAGFNGCLWDGSPTGNTLRERPRPVLWKSSSKTNRQFRWRCQIHPMNGFQGIILV
jgi:hypothetical protein